MVFDVGLRSTTENFATAYRVTFFDGEQEYDKGYIGLHSLLTYRRFQALVNQKTGIPPNQQSTVFVCRRTLKMTEKRQKLPVNENTNFGIILNQHNPSREKDCYFYVTVKKPKKDRKGRGKRNAEAEIAEDYESGSSRGEISPVDQRPPGIHDEAKSENPRPAVAAASQRGNHRGYRGKPEKTLLRRDSSSANNFSNGRSRFQVARQSEAAGMNIPVSKSENGGGFLQDEDWRRPDNKKWFHDETAATGPRHYKTATAQIPAYYPQMAGGRGLYFQDGFLQNTPGLYSKNDFTAVSSNPAVFPTRPYALQQAAAVLSLQQQMQNQYLSTMQMKPQQSQSYVMSRAFANEVLASAHGHMVAGNGTTNSNSNSTVCEQCWLAKERPVPFHCCVYDAVTSGFRGPSPAGPIEKPVKAIA